GEISLCGRRANHGAGMREAFKTDAAGKIRGQGVPDHRVVLLCFEQTLSPRHRISQGYDSKASGHTCSLQELLRFFPEREESYHERTLIQPFELNGTDGCRTTSVLFNRAVNTDRELLVAVPRRMNILDHTALDSA